MPSPSPESLAEDIRLCVMARYPLVVLQTSEEGRAASLLAAIANVCDAEFHHLEPDDHGLDALTKLDPSRRAVIMGGDWQRVVQGRPAQARRLTGLLSELEKRGHTLVVVGSPVELPPALALEAITFELPLPAPHLLATLLQDECQGLGLDIDEETRVRAIRGVQGLTAAAARRAFRRALMTDNGLRAGHTDGLVDEKRRILQRTDLLEFVEAPPSLGAVGGLEVLKDWLVERELAFDQRAREFGLPAPKGLLLVGVQGCGKSLTAKAVAQLWQLPLVRLEFGALFSVTRSPEQNLRRALKLSEALSPVVLWVDEIDKAFAAVGSNRGGSEALSRVFAAFITWMQEKLAPVFVVATANAVDHLPGELLRKGRFDEIFFVDLPSASERERIFEIHLSAHGRSPEAFDISGLAVACEHFAGAELEQVVVAALYRAFQKGRELVDEDLTVAAKSIVPLYRTAEEQVKGLRQWAASRARRASPDARIAEMWTKNRS